MQGIEAIDYTVAQFLDVYALEFDVVVEYGAGRFEKLEYVKAPLKIGVECCQEYIDFYKPKKRGMTAVCQDMCEYEPTHTGRSLAMMIDSIEHIPLADGLTLLGKLQTQYDRVLIVTPDTWTPQVHDAWNLGNEEFQTHRSLWSVDYFKEADMAIDKEINNLIFAVWDK